MDSIQKQYDMLAPEVNGSREIYYHETGTGISLSCYFLE